VDPKPITGDEIDVKPQRERLWKRLAAPLAHVQNEQRQGGRPVFLPHADVEAAPMRELQGDDRVERDDRARGVEDLASRATSPEVPAQERVDPGRHGLRRLLDEAAENVDRPSRSTTAAAVCVCA
jgi:hypothetical protein